MVVVDIQSRNEMYFARHGSIAAIVINPAGLGRNISVNLTAEQLAGFIEELQVIEHDILNYQRENRKLAVDIRNANR